MLVIDFFLEAVHELLTILIDHRGIALQGPRMRLVSIWVEANSTSFGVAPETTNAALSLFSGLNSN